MATVEVPEGAYVPGIVVGAGLALGLVTAFGYVLVTRPTAGFFLLLGSGFAGAFGTYLFVQRRESVETMHSPMDDDRHQIGESGGAIGAWVGAGDDGAADRRYRIAVVVVSFAITLFLGSFATMFLADAVAARLAALGI